mgnify:CR=1 FL=1
MLTEERFAKILSILERYGECDGSAADERNLTLLNPLCEET